jgi:hypothetical protein
MTESKRPPSWAAKLDRAGRRMQDAGKAMERGGRQVSGLGSAILGVLIFGILTAIGIYALVTFWGH